MNVYISRATEIVVAPDLSEQRISRVHPALVASKHNEESVASCCSKKRGSFALDIRDQAAIHSLIQLRDAACQTIRLL